MQRHLVKKLRHKTANLQCVAYNMIAISQYAHYTYVQYLSMSIIHMSPVDICPPVDLYRASWIVARHHGNACGGMVQGENVSIAEL